MFSLLYFKMLFLTVDKGNLSFDVALAPLAVDESVLKETTD